VGGEAVAEGVTTDALLDTCGTDSLFDTTWKVITKENLERRNPIRFGSVQIAIVSGAEPDCNPIHGIIAPSFHP
jgi:hypothetical protein